jgi:hypothetical protein
VTRPLFSARTKGQIRQIVNRAVATDETTVQLAAYLTHDRYGDQWADPVSYSAMVAYEQRLVTNMAGQQVTSKGTVLFPFPAPAVAVEDRLTLADGTTPPILAVSHDTSDDPLLATIVYF